MWIADIRRQRPALLNDRSRTARFLSRWSSLLRTGGCGLLIAPQSIHKFPVVSKTNVVPRQIVPKKSSRRIVDVGLIMFQGIFVSDLSLEIVGALFAAIGDLPSLFVVIGSDRRR